MRFLLFFLTYAAAKIISPASIPASNFTSPTADLPLTDSFTIAKTVSLIDQKSGAVGFPNQPVPNTFVTAIDGKIILPSPTNQKSPVPLLTRSALDYDLVFNGTGLSPNARDAAIQGTAYLTFSLIPNSTYNVDPCLRFCDSVPGCSTHIP